MKSNYEIITMGNREMFFYLNSLSDDELKELRHRGLYPLKWDMIRRAEKAVYADGMAIAILRGRGFFTFKDEPEKT
jgi:hypothetical protein